MVNDSLVTNFEIWNYFDVAVDSSILPKQDYTLLEKTTYQPQFYRDDFRAYG